MPEAIFSYQDKEALHQIQERLHYIDNNGRLKELLDKIISICEEIGAKVINATDEDNNYTASIEIDHETTPAEVRFCIKKKLVFKFGQYFAAMADRKGATDALTLTKNGYGTNIRATTPKAKNGSNLHDRHLVEYSMSSFSNIYNFLRRFRKILDPKSQSPL